MPLQINTRSRVELKQYFVQNAIPTESNFAELIDAMLNQREDGIAKLPTDALSIEAAGDDTSQKKAINLYNNFSDANPAWVLSLNPRQDPANAATAKAGFSISDGGTGISRLFVDKATGGLGVGTNEPKKKLHVQGASSGPFINDVHDRPAIAITGHYPELALFSNVANPNHGPSIRIGAYTDAAATTFKQWVIGTAGRDARFLDIGFSDKNDPNPHAGIRNYNGNTILTFTETGKVGIGTLDPAAQLSIVAPNASQTAGTVRSAALLVSAGTLGSSPETQLVLASFGFHSPTSNSSHLGIRAYRMAAGGDWTTTSIGLCMDVDNTIGAGASLFLSANGGIGIGTPRPRTRLHVSGNANVLDLEGGDHAYIEWYPMGIASGRKGWIGYGGAGTTALCVASEAGPLVLAGAGVSVPTSLEVTNGSSFAGGRHYFRDAEGAGRVRLGAAWGVPGIYAEDGDDIVVGCASGKRVLLGQTNGVIIREGKIATGGRDPEEGAPHGLDGGVTTFDLIAHGAGYSKNGWQTISWDLAEKFQHHEEGLEPGDVLAVDPHSPERLVKSRTARQDDLAGVFSERPGFVLGLNWEDPESGIPLALAGRVPVKVNLEGGAIRIGDYLTSSSQPGVAMRTIRPGRVIGLAMEAFEGGSGGEGKIVVLVNPHWFGGR